MFQFGRFPSYTYWFSARSSCFTWWGFPIRIPADRGLFAAPRSFSQLIASFFGFRCQGIHLMLFLAWTSFVLFSCLSFANNFVTMKKLFRFYVFRLDSFESRLNCSFFTTISWKTFLFNSFSEISKLSVRFLLYSVSNDLFVCHVSWHSLVGSSGVEPPTSCLSGMRSNLLSYEPILELPVGFLHLSSGGDEGIRTLDPLLAGQVLSQLSYTPSRVFTQTVSEDKTTTSKSFGHLSVSLIRIGSCSSNITDSP